MEPKFRRQRSIWCDFMLGRVVLGKSITGLARFSFNYGSEATQAKTQLGLLSPSQFQNLMMLPSQTMNRCQPAAKIDSCNLQITKTSIFVLGVKALNLCCQKGLVMTCAKQRGIQPSPFFHSPCHVFCRCALRNRRSTMDEKLS